MKAKVYPEQCLAQALLIHPGLGSNGLWSPEAASIRRDPQFLDQIQHCLEWLRFQKTIKTINHSHSSYGYKHMVERWCGSYIPNGAFIAAAIGMGIKWKPADYGRNPNAYFAISNKLLTAPPRLPRMLRADA